MTILVTGATGKVGSEVVRQLLARAADFRVMVRDPTKIALPREIPVYSGDFSDVSSVRRAFAGIDTLFLLNPVAPGELFQAMTMLNLAADARIERIVYLSLFGRTWLSDVPHVAAKLPVEDMIEARGLSATLLRATLFMQNDLVLWPVLSDSKTYAMPIGSRGVAMVDVRDVGEAAALELIRRDHSDSDLPLEKIVACGPEVLTGSKVAAIWGDVLDRDVTYAGDDLDRFEKLMVRIGTPEWLAYDLRLMFKGLQTDGQFKDGAAEKFGTLLGRTPRSYRTFATEAAASWK